MYELNEGHPFRPLHEMLSQYCAREGILTLDLLDVFQGEDYARLWVHPSDQHPNERGHRIAAEAMAEFILAGDLRQMQLSIDLDEAARALLDEWLRRPEEIAEALGADPEELKKMTPEELKQ